MVPPILALAFSTSPPVRRASTFKFSCAETAPCFGEAIEAISSTVVSPMMGFVLPVISTKLAFELMFMPDML